MKCKRKLEPGDLSRDERIAIMESLPGGALLPKYMEHVRSLREKGLVWFNTDIDDPQLVGWPHLTGAGFDIRKVLR